MLLELGGNAPCVIDEGADLDVCLRRQIVAGAWAQAGQVCIKVQRVLVHALAVRRFLERFVADTRAVVVRRPDATRRRSSVR